MSDEIIENLWREYKDKFRHINPDFDALREKFDTIIKWDYQYMPYWLVLKIVDLGIDISAEENPF